MDGLAISILFLVVLSFLLFVIRVGLIFYHNILLARELKRLTQEAEVLSCAECLNESSYVYSLYGYLVFLLLLCLFLIAIKMAYRRKQIVARQAALAERARRGNNSVTAPAATCTDNQTNQPPKDDLPPAYEDVVKTKLALQAAAEEGRMATNHSNNHSTLTFTTIADASGSRADLSTMTRATLSAAESYETLPPAYENAVFESEDSTNGIRNEHAHM